MDMAIRWLAWAQSSSKARLEWVRRNGHAWMARDRDWP